MTRPASIWERLAVPRNQASFLDEDMYDGYLQRKQVQWGVRPGMVATLHNPVGKPAVASAQGETTYKAVDELYKRYAEKGVAPMMIQSLFLQMEDGRVYLGTNFFSEVSKKAISNALDTPAQGTCACSRGEQCDWPHESYRPAVDNNGFRPALSVYCQSDCGGGYTGWTNHHITDEKGFPAWAGDYKLMHGRYRRNMAE